MALSLIYLLHESLGHAKSPQSSLVVSLQRIYNSLTVTTAHIKSSFRRLRSLYSVPRLQFSFSFFHNCLSELYYDRRSVGQSVLVSSPHLGLMTRFLLLSDSCGFADMGPSSLMRARVCLLQLLLSSPAQSLSGPSPAGLMTSFYCLRFETPPTWRTRFLYLYPPGRGWPGYTPRHWVTTACFGTRLSYPLCTDATENRLYY
jgi:hypothetical protein